MAQRRERITAGGIGGSCISGICHVPDSLDSLRTSVTPLELWEKKNSVERREREKVERACERVERLDRLTDCFSSSASRLHSLNITNYIRITLLLPLRPRTDSPKAGCRGIILPVSFFSCSFSFSFPLGPQPTLSLLYAGRLHLERVCTLASRQDPCSKVQAGRGPPFPAVLARTTETERETDRWKPG